MRSGCYIVVAGILAVLGVASAQEDTVSPSELTYASDGKGHVLGYRIVDGAVANVFVGTAKRLHRMYWEGSTSDSGVFSFDFRDPRFGDDNGWRRHQVKIMTDHVEVSCGRERLKLVPVSAKERARIVSKAKLHPPLKRDPVVLARNDDAVYVYADRGPGRYDVQLYRGRRGNMKRLTMKDVIEDSSGRLFVSTVGSLKSVPTEKGRAKIFWSEKGKVSELDLVSLDFSGTENFIFNELGVYLGKPLGTPCDWL